jgi:outer membrane lipoprotein-sorting protein/peroxiredoxin
MSMRKGLILAILATVSLGGLRADTPPKDLLTAVEDAYWDLQSYQDVSTSTIRYKTANSEYVLSVTSVLRYKRPRLVYVESKSDRVEGNGTFVFDGDTYWIYRKDLGRYMKAKTLTSQDFARYVPFADYFVLGMLIPRFAGTSQVLEEGFDNLTLAPDQDLDGTKCRLLRGTCKRGWIKLWVTADTHLVVQMIGEHTDARDGSKLSFFETHKEIKTNVTFPPTVFAFAAPRDAVLVDSFGERPGGLGKVDLSGVPNEGALQNGDPCPDFSLGGTGEQTANQQLKGSQVVLSFWTLESPGAAQAIRDHLMMLQKLATEMGPSGLVVISVQWGEETEEQKAMLGEVELAFKLVSDDGTLFTKFRVMENPTIYVIDRRGRIAGSLVGQHERTEAMLRDILAKAD